jgi:hypothetical protein
MVSSVFSPSLRRLARMWRAWQRPLLSDLKPLAATPALDAGGTVQEQVSPDYPRQPATFLRR